MKKLYRVKYTDQHTGKDRTEYILCSGLAELEQGIDDIVYIELLHHEELD
jgi:hypothetical protein